MASNDRSVSIQPGAGKNTGLLVGLGVCAVLAIIGLGLTIWLGTGRAAKNTTIAQHEDGALKLAATLGLTLAADTNSPVVWAAAWSNLESAVAAQKAGLDEAKTKAEAVEKQIADQKTEIADLKSKGAALEKQASEQKAAVADAVSIKAAADGQAKLLAQKSAELEASKAAAKTQVEAMEKELAALREKAAAPKVAVPAAPAAVAAKGGAPAGKATSAAKTPSAAAIRPLAEDGSCVFPAGTSRLVKSIAYDAGDNTLRVRLASDALLSYKGVAAEVFDSFRNAPVPDVFFRMKIFGSYPCTPDEKAAVAAIKNR